MRKYRVTKKSIKEASSIILMIPYCGAQNLLAYFESFAYSVRAEGWACDYYDINGVIISTGYAPIGKAVSYTNMRLIINKINAQTDMSMAPISLHNLRHTFATRCFEEGIHAKTVQSLLGHMNISTTMDVYTHVNQDIIQQAINKITL